MRVIYKLALFILLFNIAVSAVGAVTGAPVAAPQSEASLEGASGLAETATSNVVAAVASNAIPVLGDFLQFIKPVFYIEDTLRQYPFNLGFEISPGITFAHAIQLIVWMVYAAAVIDMFMHSRITRD